MRPAEDEPTTWERLAELQAELDELAVPHARYVAVRREARRLADALDGHPARDADDELEGDSSDSYCSCESSSSPERPVRRAARTATPIPSSPDSSSSHGEDEPEVIVPSSSDDSDDKSGSSTGQQSPDGSPVRVEPEVFILSDSDDNGDDGAQAVATPHKDTRTLAMLDTPAKNTRAARRALAESNTGGKGEAA
ncbi:hypothetical protein JCM8208_003818 [Rhodotorula glutinis]